jgi:hypothetical protein
LVVERLEGDLAAVRFDVFALVFLVTDFFVVFGFGSAAAFFALVLVGRLFGLAVFVFVAADALFRFGLEDLFLAAPIAAPERAPITVPTTGTPRAVPATAPAAAPPRVPLVVAVMPSSCSFLSSISLAMNFRDTTLRAAARSVKLAPRTGSSRKAFELKVSVFSALVEQQVARPNYL